jgi:hypothetical protein
VRPPGNNVTGAFYMVKLEEVLKAVEKLRSKLNKLYNQKGIIDAEIVKLSQMLDTMLNEHERLIKK